jgi:hypothetical protein
MNNSWESQLAELLTRLGVAQEDLLALLATKRELLMKRDHCGLAELVPREDLLCAELQACHDWRQEILDQAAEAGLPCDSIESLARRLPHEEAAGLAGPIKSAVHRSHLLRSQSIAQWVVVQRTVLHLSHMLEIIATGGRTKPTYGKGADAHRGGALMDQAV